ncbi:hypothetical protein N9M12_00445 [Gammaproteobacteria bacterium]|nr:hypothetical protein [Gammaproteobacteria bacterium]
MYLIKTSKSKFILWNFHDVNIDNFLKDIPSSKYLHIGEDYDPSNDENEEHVKKFRERNKVHLLEYSSSRLPNKIFSCFSNTKGFDLTYSGTLYKKSWIQELQKKYNCNFLIYPPKINENERIKNFTNGHINLCFHHDDSIRKGIITERFSESISMGGIVVHDSPKIHKLYGHCSSIFFVENINQLFNAIEKILNLDQLTLKELRSQSFKLWQSSNLNYQKQVELIIEAFNEKNFDR